MIKCNADAENHITLPKEAISDFERQASISLRTAGRLGVTAKDLTEADQGARPD